MSALKLCIKEISETLTQMAVVPSEKWPDVKDKYQGFTVDHDVDNEHIKRFFRIRWPNGFSIIDNDENEDEFKVMNLG